MTRVSILAELASSATVASLGVVARSSYIQKNSQLTENFMRALLEGLAFVRAPANKAATLQLLQRRLRVSASEAEEGFKDMALGLDRKPYPSLDGLRNIQRLRNSENRVITKIDGLFSTDLRKRQHGFIDRLYNAAVSTVIHRDEEFARQTSFSGPGTV
jgi:hypothetical protein